MVSEPASFRKRIGGVLRKRPAGWNKPDGLGVQWMEAPADTNRISRGKAIRINTAITEKAMMAQWQSAGINEWNIPKPTDAPVAAAYGLSFYSDTLPVAKAMRDELLAKLDAVNAPYKS